MKTTIVSPYDLFFDQLKDLHSMESQISGHLPDLLAKAADERLRQIIIDHSFETDTQLATIRGLFSRHGRDPGDDKCKVISGLIEGGNAHLASVENTSTRDLMMVAHWLRVERYEIAAYEIASRLAGQLGFTEDAGVLLELLAQEQNAADGILGLEPNLFQNASLQS